MQANKQSRVINAIVAACGNTTAHSNCRPRSIRVEADTLPDALNTVEIVVAAHQNMTVRRTPRYTRAATLFRHNRHNSPAKPVAAHDPQNLIERFGLTICMSTNLVHQQRM